MVSLCVMDVLVSLNGVYVKRSGKRGQTLGVMFYSMQSDTFCSIICA